MIPWRSIVAATLACLAGASGPACADGAPTGMQRVEAGPVRLELALDRTTMNAAQSLRVTLRVTSPAGVRVDLPPADGKLGGFAITSTDDRAPLASSNGADLETTRVRTFTLEPFLPGEYTLPTFEVGWTRDASREHGVVRTAPVAVRVVSLLPDGAKDAPPDPGTIREAYAAPARTSTRAVVLAASVAGVALGGAGVWALRRRRRGVDLLDSLEHRVRDLRLAPGPGRSGLDACHELAGYVRLALADRVHPSAASLAPGELAQRLGANKASVRQGAELLERLDAARFAGGAVVRADLDSWADSAMALMRLLRAGPGDPPVGEALP